MTRFAAHAVVFLLVFHAVKASSDTELAKRDLEDKWPVLSAILEKLFLPDECIYYTKLSSFGRSIDFKDPLTNPLCDEDLEHGWFRFTGSAGSRMTTSCVTKPKDLHCSAINPGWMDGEHPSIEDGRVKRKVCFNVDGKCCQAFVNIHVRNCGPFYVYHLVGVPCPFRYCGSHAAFSTATPEITVTPKPLPTEPAEMTTEETTTLPPFPTFPENITTEELTTLAPFPTTEPENVTTTAEPTTLPPFPPMEPENVTTTAEPTTLPPFPPMEPENFTTPETTTLPPLPTEPTSPTTTLPPSPSPEDECSNYKTLVEPSRAASFNDPYVVEGDHELVTGWYRFTEQAGTKMADKCVDVYHCGTNAPGWLYGGHPTNASNQAVWKTVCFSWAKNCCYFKGHIQVRECGDFFVYHLRQLRVRYLRYCGNDTALEDINARN